MIKFTSKITYKKYFFPEWKDAIEFATLHLRGYILSRQPHIYSQNLIEDYQDLKFYLINCNTLVTNNEYFPRDIFINDGYIKLERISVTENVQRVFDYLYSIKDSSKSDGWARIPSIKAALSIDSSNTILGSLVGLIKAGAVVERQQEMLDGTSVFRYYQYNKGGTYA